MLLLFIFLFRFPWKPLALFFSRGWGKRRLVNKFNKILFTFTEFADSCFKVNSLNSSQFKAFLRQPSVINVLDPWNLLFFFMRIGEDGTIPPPHPPHLLCRLSVILRAISDMNILCQPHRKCQHLHQVKTKEGIL